MVPGKQTIFLLLETSRDLAKTANLDSTHMSESNLALFAMATADGVLAAVFMGK
jgi:hypothetical protein